MHIYEWEKKVKNEVVFFHICEEIKVLNFVLKIWNFKSKKTLLIISYRLKMLETRQSSNWYMESIYLIYYIRVYVRRILYDS